MAIDLQKLTLRRLLDTQSNELYSKVLNQYFTGINSVLFDKIKSFIVPPKKGINYKPGIWHFPLITTEDTSFLVIDRKGSGDNLIIHNFDIQI